MLEVHRESGGFTLWNAKHISRGPDHIELIKIKA
jgi:hypothetical protein